MSLHFATFTASNGKKFAIDSKRVEQYFEDSDGHVTIVWIDMKCERNVAQAIQSYKEVHYALQRAAY